jgi:hypothetical protein
MRVSSGTPLCCGNARMFRRACGGTWLSIWESTSPDISLDMMRLASPSAIAEVIEEEEEAGGACCWRTMWYSLAARTSSARLPSS